MRTTPGSGEHHRIHQGQRYADLVGLGEIFGPDLKLATLLRDWVRRGVLASVYPLLPAHYRDRGRNWYQVDAVSEAEYLTSGKTKPRIDSGGTLAA